MATPDPVTDAVAGAVLRRDGFACVAPSLGASSRECRDQWGERAVVSTVPFIYRRAALTLDHVRDEPMMGKRAPSDVQHLVTLCWWHHLEGWATSHRPDLRQYLKENP